jgi:outer membrane protein assembly factor BamB
MKTATLVAGVCLLLVGEALRAQDWPQWRGPNRDGKTTGFAVPKTWPKELTQKWKVAVGDGVATPALVGDRLYVFTRVGENEVLRCLAAADGKEIWSDKYAAAAFGGADSGFQGPRSSPTVADGKIVTLGSIGILSCYDTEGKVLWRKEDYKGAVPPFHVSSSPIIVDGLCIAQLGGGRKGSKGVIVAYDLATGAEKWKSTGESPGYASPMLLSVGNAKAIVAETLESIVAVGLTDGKELWHIPYPVQAMGYNASTPMVDGQTVIYSGSARGTKAVKMEKKDDGLAAKELWSNMDNSVQFNSPVLKNGLIFGISSSDKLFCINAETGKTAWSTTLGAPSGAPGGRAGGAPGAGAPGGRPGGGAPGAGAPGGGGGRGRGMRGGPRPGYGSIVDAGSVLVGLTPVGNLIVFEPSEKAFNQIARYKVAAGDTYAYPVLSGNRVFIKDKDSVILFTID